MAYLSDDQDKLQQPGDQGQAAAQGAGGGSAVPLGSQNSGGSFVGSNSVSNAGVGAGGQGNWTNIQSYLNANHGNTSSSKLVDDVGNKLDEEKTKLTDSATKATNDAKSGADATNIGSDAASNLVNQAAKSGQGTDTYNQNTGQIKNALNYNYQGPQNYSYALDPKVDEYQKGLNNTQTGDFMEGLYRQAAGGQLTNGQLNLQRQLDLDEPAAQAIEQSKQNALQKYAGLMSTYNQVVPDTDKAVQDYVSQMGQNKSNLSGYLNQTEQQKNQSLQDAMNAWNREEQSIKNGVPSQSDPTYYHFENPNVAGQGEWQTVDKSKFYSYQPGRQADLGNVDSQGRDQFNTIADILGQSQIQATDPAQHGNININGAGLAQAIEALKQSQLAKGFIEDETSGWTAEEKRKYDQTGIAPAGRWSDRGVSTDPGPFGTRTSKGVF